MAALLAVEKTYGISNQQYDVVVYIADDQVVAEDQCGLEIRSGAAGTEDDTVIQVALDSLKNGGRLLIRAGTYNISNMLLIRYSNIEVTGAGMDKTILFNKCKTAQPLGGGVIRNEVHNVLHSRDDLKLTGIVVRHLTIDGNQNEIPKSNGAELSNVDDSGFEYVKVKNSMGGLYVTSWERGSRKGHNEYAGLKFIRNCVADNCTAEGFCVPRSVNVKITGNVATRPWLFANGWCHMINAEDSDHVRIENNKVFAMPIG
jgi:polygalacturonase